MRALDTNILVRLLVKDDAAQSQKVIVALERAEAAGETLYVPILVVLELNWVLSSNYRKSRDEILDCLDQLVHISTLAFESAQVVKDLIAMGRVSSIDLSDLLIGLNARQAGCETTLTFDRHAARSGLFTEL